MNRITFPFDEIKATQVIGIKTARCEGIFDFYLAMKALYALDRAALLRWGQPIIGGYYRMLPYGPVNQSALDAVGERLPGVFSSHFERFGNEIVINADPATDDLSKAEMQLTQEVCDEWKSLSFNAAHRKANSFPECQGLQAVTEIDPETILVSAGQTPEQIAEVASSSAELRLLKAA